MLHYIMIPLAVLTLLGVLMLTYLVILGARVCRDTERYLTRYGAEED